VGPEGKVNQDFESQGVGKENKSGSLKDQNPKTRSPKIFRDGRTVVDFKGDNCVVGLESKETKFLEFGD
jgi:hypothetical protein